MKSKAELPKSTSQIDAAQEGWPKMGLLDHAMSRLLGESPWGKSRPIWSSLTPKEAYWTQQRAPRQVAPTC